MFLGIVFPKNKILFGIFSIWLLCLLAGNSGGADFDGYEEYFEIGKYWDVNLFLADSFLFNTAYVANSLGLDLYEHNFIIYFFIVLLLFCIIYKLSRLPNLVLVFFTIYPYVDFIIQKRNVLAICFIFIGIYFFIKRFGDKIGIFIYLLCCYFAYLIHSSSLAYIMFIPIYLIYSLDNKSLRKFLFILGFFILFIFMLNIEIIMPILFPAKAQAYVMSEEGKLALNKVSVFIFIHLLYFLFQRKFYYLSIESNMKIGREELYLIKVSYILSIISLFFVPFYFFNITYFRIFRNLFMLIFISGANVCLIELDKVSINRLLLIIIFFIIQIFMFLFSYVLTGEFSFNKLVHPIFTENVLFSISMF